MTGDIGKPFDPSREPMPVNMVGANATSGTAGSVSLVDLARINFFIGLSSFGGGLLSWFAREFTERRRWVNYGDLLSGYALSQFIPGPSNVNLSLHFGSILKGLLGAVVAFLALVAPPSFLVIGIYAAYTRAPFAQLAQSALEGIAVAAAGLNIAVGIKAGRRSSDWRAIVITAAVFVAVAILRVPILWVILVAMPVSLAVVWRDDRHAKSEDE